MTGLHVFQPGISRHDERMPVPIFRTHSFVQQRAKGIGAENADDERRVGFREGIDGPGGELREIKQEDRLELIFT